MYNMNSRFQRAFAAIHVVYDVETRNACDALMTSEERRLVRLTACRVRHCHGAGQCVFNWRGRQALCFLPFLCAPADVTSPHTKLAADSGHVRLASTVAILLVS